MKKALVIVGEQGTGKNMMARGIAEWVGKGTYFETSMTEIRQRGIMTEVRRNGVPLFPGETIIIDGLCLADLEDAKSFLLTHSLMDVIFLSYDVDALKVEMSDQRFCIIRIGTSS
jgi:ABC-type dipeptide/oligopeptide/nickel transport system ATPase component